MSFEFVRKLPTPHEVKEEFPVPEQIMEIKKKCDEEIKDVFTGKSDKFIAIIGPCSADNEVAVLDYVTRLKKVQEKSKIRLLLFLVFIQTNQEQQVQDIKECFISLTLRKNLTFLQVLLP